GLPFQVHFSVTDRNADEIPGMIDFARATGAHVLNVFFLICTGRGESMSDISPQRYETALKQLVDAQRQHTDLIIRARCAPHYKRIAYQRDPASPLTRAEGYDGGGCLAGIHYCRITPEGGVTACPYLPEEDGSIRERPFWEIWDHAPGFQRLRRPALTGACGECEYRLLCGGCRARPKALGGGLMDADPWCSHRPQGGAVIQPLSAPHPTEITWSTEAEQRLARVPGFLRKMVRKRAESYVREQGKTEVTPKHLAVLAKRRFDQAMPARSGNGVASISDAGAAPLSDAPSLPWSTEARHYLNETPAFLRDGVRQVAEEVARSEGRLEVNVRLLQRLEEEGENRRAFPWTPEAEQRLEVTLQGKGPQVRMFIRPTLEAAAEREVKRRRAQKVTVADVEKVVTTQTAGVAWSREAMARVESAPEFVRGGIKKAAEFAARREGLTEITPADLTRFRNRAMMRAVKRMKGFDMRELDFAAFEIAKERIPRLRDNPQAVQRFAEIREYVQTHQAPDGSGLGLLGRDLIERMKAELKEK
ncbi:MAG TPA: SPASM domain-containing protein, partial [Chromatiales bacterium]|nr:SPASM domain-containing protein [Chromatiales bacterium]